MSACFRFTSARTASNFAFASFQCDIQPVSRAFCTVHPNLCRFEQRRYYDVHSAVAIEVSEGTAPVPRRRSRCQTRLGDQRSPAAARAWVAKNRIVLPDLRPGLRQRLDMASADE